MLLAGVELVNRSSSCYVWTYWNCLCWCRSMTARFHQSSTSMPSWVSSTPSSHSWFAAVMCLKVATPRARSVHSYTLNKVNRTLVYSAVWWMWVSFIKHSGMTGVNEWLRGFTYHPHLRPHIERALPLLYLYPLACNYDPSLWDWVALGGWLRYCSGMPTKMVTHPSTNQSGR